MVDIKTPTDKKAAAGKETPEKKTKRQERKEFELKNAKNLLKNVNDSYYELEDPAEDDEEKEPVTISTPAASAAPEGETPAGTTTPAAGQELPATPAAPAAPEGESPAGATMPAAGQEQPATPAASAAPEGETPAGATTPAAGQEQPATSAASAAPGGENPTVFPAVAMVTQHLEDLDNSGKQPYTEIIVIPGEQPANDASQQSKHQSVQDHTDITTTTKLKTGVELTIEEELLNEIINYKVSPDNKIKGKRSGYHFSTKEDTFLEALSSLYGIDKISVVKCLLDAALKKYGPFVMKKNLEKMQKINW